MTKHIIDGKRAGHNSNRPAQFVRIASDEHPRSQSKLLQKRRQDTSLAARARRFLQIERQGGL